MDDMVIVDIPIEALHFLLESMDKAKRTFSKYPSYVLQYIAIEALKQELAIERVLAS